MCKVTTPRLGTISHVPPQVRNLGNVTVISRLKDDYLGTTGACTTLPATGSPAVSTALAPAYPLAPRGRPGSAHAFTRACVLPGNDRLRAL